MKTRTQIEKKIVEKIAYMWYEEYLKIETEIAKSGETVFHLKQGKEFNPEACTIFFEYISTKCKQYAEMKIGSFHHIIWNFDNIVINFWDCE